MLDESTFLKFPELPASFICRRIQNRIPYLRNHVCRGLCLTGLRVNAHSRRANVSTSQQSNYRARTCSSLLKRRGEEKGEGEEKNRGSIDGFDRKHIERALLWCTLDKRSLRRKLYIILGLGKRFINVCGSFRRSKNKVLDAASVQLVPIHQTPALNSVQQRKGFLHKGRSLRWAILFLKREKRKSDRI